VTLQRRFEAEGLALSAAERAVEEVTPKPSLSNTMTVAL
jgi:hypothetical protein